VLSTRIRIIRLVRSDTTTVRMRYGFDATTVCLYSSFTSFVGLPLILHVGFSSHDLWSSSTILVARSHLIALYCSRRHCLFTPARMCSAAGCLSCHAEHNVMTDCSTGWVYKQRNIAVRPVSALCSHGNLIHKLVQAVHHVSKSCAKLFLSELCQYVHQLWKILARR